MEARIAALESHTKIFADQYSQEGQVNGEVPLRVVEPPLDIEGLTLWLDASEGEYVDNVLVSLSDKSVNKTHPTLEGSANAITYTQIRGRGAMAIDGDAWMRGDISLTGPGVTVFAVADAASAPNDYDAFRRLVSVAGYGDCDWANPRSCGLITTTQNTAELTLQNAGSGDVRVPLPLDAPFVVMSCRNAETGSVGMAHTEMANLVTGNSTNEPLDSSRYAIGNQPFDNDGRWRGAIGEVMIYNRDLTEYEKVRVFSYLRQKWAIPPCDPSEP
jgi:hypothetical protein